MHHVIIVACPFPTFDFKQVNDCDKEHACPSILYLAMIQTLTQQKYVFTGQENKWSSAMTHYVTVTTPTSSI